MIKYFRELENPKEQYLDLVDRYHSLDYPNIKLKYLPLDYFIKHKVLFEKIEDYDLLYEKNNKQIELYTNPENAIEEDDIWGSGFDFDWMFKYDMQSGILTYKNIEGSGLSKKALDKICELEYKLSLNREKMDMEYFCNIIDMLLESNHIFYITLKQVYKFLKTSYDMAKVQGKLNTQDELLFKEAFADLKKYVLEFPKKKYEPVKMYLPNAWYITPYNHLYNTMGKDGHKEAGLIYPYYNRIIENDNVSNPSKFLENIKKKLEDGCIDKITFEHYTNLRYDFVSIYPEEYYHLSKKDQFRYRTIYAKTYNPRIVNLIIGIESATAGLYSFFYNLKNNSLDYKSDLEYLKQYDLDEILVRCCGFHKISSIFEKTITTSCINYEEEFYEYIKRGWRIDFVKPIIFNENTRRIEEYSDDFLKIRKILKNYR